MSLTDETIIRRNGSHVSTDLDGELILMHAGSGEVFELRDNSREIWHQLASPTSFGSLVQRLMSRFDVDRATCESEVRSFVLALSEMDLVRID